MNPNPSRSPARLATRRDFLNDAVLGVGGIALAQVLLQDQARAAGRSTFGVRHHPSRAKRLWMLRIAARTTELSAS